MSTPGAHGPAQDIKSSTSNGAQKPNPPADKKNEQSQGSQQKTEKKEKTTSEQVKDVVFGIIGVLCIAIAITCLVYGHKDNSWKHRGSLYPCAQVYTCIKPYLIEHGAVHYIGGNKLDAMLVARKPTKKALHHFKYDFHQELSPVKKDNTWLHFSFFLNEGSTITWTIYSKQRYIFQLMRADTQLEECYKKAINVKYIGKVDACRYIRNEAPAKTAWRQRFDAHNKGKYRIVLKPKDTQSITFEKIEFSVDYVKFDLADNIIETKKGQYTFSLSKTGEGECVFVDHKCDKQLQLVQGSLQSPSHVNDDPSIDFSLDSTFRRKPQRWIAGILFAVSLPFVIVVFITQPSFRSFILKGLGQLGIKL